MWGILVVLSAIAIQRWWVPVLRRPYVEPGDVAPDFRPLGSVPNLTLVAALAALGAVATPQSGPTMAPWLVYVALGAPLVVVDLRTTYLPNQLMVPLWATMALAWLPGLVTDPWAAAKATLGAGVAYCCFWLVWRWSSSFGFGDVRLAAAVGAVAASGGATGWLTAMVMGTGLGAVAAIVASALRRRVFPYGPWLWLGPIVATWVPTGS